MSATIETLVLEDRFSAVFSSYLNLGRQIGSTMTMVASSQNDFTAAAVQSGAALSEMAGSGTRAADAVEDIVEANRKMGDSANAASNKQEEMNRSLRNGASAADSFTGKLKGLIATYAGFQSIKSALSWVEGSLDASNIQRNAENQLKAVLANMGAQDIAVPVIADINVDTTKTMTAFDAIARKASEIQGKGIYGDEAMIAGAAEFATYFSDANAILSMMDTLSNYTMGMTGGGAVDQSAMVEYATGLGKIMTGSYDAMTKKGFEFTNTQKAIIEGTASEAQVVAELGAEYLSMSQEMQAAATINNVISESWGGLYESMSNTPEGKIIQLKNTLGDLREMLGNALYPAVMRLVNTINDHYPQIERMLTCFAYGCSLIIDGITWVVDKLAWAFEWVEQNWETMSNLLISGTVAIATAMAVSAAIAAASWIIVNWPFVLLIGIIVQVIYTARQMGATWEDVFARVGAGAGWLYTLVYNLIADAWNVIAIFTEFLGNVFNHPLESIARLFIDTFSAILGIIETVAGALDVLTGWNAAGVISSFRTGLNSWADSILPKEYTVNRMEKISYDNTMAQWAAAGAGLGRSVDNFSLSNFMSGMNGSAYNFDAMSSLSGINSALDDIGADTKAIKNSVSLSEEDIRLLVDMATREYVNNINLTSQTPIINVTGQNTGDTEMDKWALADAIKDVLLEEVASHTDLAYT